MSPRWWCTYCDYELATEEQVEAHEDCDHIVKEIEVLLPDDDHRLKTYREFADAD